MKHLIRLVLCSAAVAATPWLYAQFVVPSGTAGVGTSPNGNVGIGTSTPFAKLDVEGKVNIGSGTTQNTFLSADTQLQIFSDSNVATQMTFWQSGVALSHIGHKALDSKFYITNGYDGSALGTAGRSLTLDTAGNVGIGTNSPTSALDVANSASIRASQDGTGTRYTSLQTSGYMGRVSAASALFGLVLQSDYSSGFISFNTGGPYERMKIDAVGNVGIGTGNATGRLTVYGPSGSAYNNGVEWFVGNPGGYYGWAGRIYSGNPSGGWATAPFVFAVPDGSGNEIQTMVLKGGSVGIGTTTPSAPLTVSSTTYPQVRVDNPTALASGIDFYTMGTSQRARVGWYAGGGAQSGLWLWNYDNSNLVFGTTNTQRMTIDWQGNVGIGTTNPTNKLEVNGTIRTKEVVVETTGWSDYVFADDYRLAPLSEVEAHIRSNKHLPGIPSATEVAGQGINLGEMQAKLLAKVEELTLHVIRLEKENQQLRRDVNELQTDR